MNELNDEFWSSRYNSNLTGWDLGEVSRPLKEYIDQLVDKDISILIPGCGNSYEAEYLLSKGFKKVTLIDISKVLTDSLKRKFVNEIKANKCEVIHGDFFSLEGNFDLILEQTFFCALDPSLRESYAIKMSQLLSKKGVLAGVLFGVQMPGGPPFGGSADEYLRYFEKYFESKMSACYNSIKPREGKELFIQLKLKN